MGLAPYSPNGAGFRNGRTLLSQGLVLQNTKGAGVEQRVLQALMAKRFPKIVAQLEKADTSVEVRKLSSSQCFNLQSARHEVNLSSLGSGCP